MIGALAVAAVCFWFGCFWFGVGFCLLAFMCMCAGSRYYSQAEWDAVEKELEAELNEDGWN